MKNIKKILAIVAIGITSGCSDSTSTETVNKPASPEQQTEKTIDITGLNFASKTDTTCGMPLSAGVTDTAIVNGRLYGFCSAECKETFLKSQAIRKDSL